jgi:hypothetical protein
MGRGQLGIVFRAGSFFWNSGQIVLNGAGNVVRLSDRFPYVGCGIQTSGGEAMSLKRRNNAIAKCEEARRAIERIKLEPEHPAYSKILAEHERSLKLWRQELDRVW